MSILQELLAILTEAEEDVKEERIAPIKETFADLWEMLQKED